MPPPLYRPKIFISHSAKDEPAQKLMNALEKALSEEVSPGNPEFEVLLDKRVLKPGDEWRAAIDEWILRCDAAIILFSKDAVESQYVLYETTYLRGRWKTRKDSFTLIPVRFADVTVESLKDAMGPLQLGEIQHLLMSQSGDGGGDEVVEDTVRRVKELLKPLQDRLAERHEFEKALSEILYHQVPQDEGLEEICDAVTGRKLMPGAKRDKAIVLARALLEADEAFGAGRFRRIERAVEAMRNIIPNVDFVRRVINIVTPFCWVDPRVALNLLVVAARESQPRLVAWRRSWLLSEEMHLCRGYCGRKNSGFRMIVVSDSWSGDLEQDLKHVRRCLGENLCYDPDAAEQRVAKKISNLEAEGKPTFLVMPAKSVHREFVSELQGRWGNVTFIFHDRGLSKAQMQEWGLGQVAFLEPQLDPETEDAALESWGDLLATTGVDRESIRQGSAFLQ